MTPEPPSVVAAVIAEEIHRHGPMRFDRYMELALYAPGGYYDDPPVGAGPRGDFVTSPHVHPVFAQMLGEAIRDLHRAMGAPEPFELIEAGAGDGTLLRALLPELAGLDMRVIALESSVGARAALADLDGIDVRDSFESPRSPALILAHELMDNLPFRRVRTTADGPREVYVGLDGDRFVEVLEAVADLHPRGDTETIVPRGAASFMVEALRGQPPRALLAIDYGSDTGAGGPAHGYASHSVVEDLLATPGSTDITAGVDFGYLADAARTSGLYPFPTVSQHDALSALGFEAWLRTELERQRDLLNTDRSGAAVGAWGGRGRAAMLADPTGLGRFRWFVVASRDVAEPSWLRIARTSAAEA